MILRAMLDRDCVEFLQWALPRMHMRWPGFRRVRRQVCRRIARRLESLALGSPAEYRDYLLAHPAEWKALDEMCRITISRFYRDRSVFEYLSGQVLPRLALTASERPDHAVTCWSAGCCSGEEVYTLQILWRNLRQAQSPAVILQIIGTDADAHLLQRARAGRYKASSLRELPLDLRALAFESAGDALLLKPAYGEHVEFAEQDSRHDMPAGPFDIILCRNFIFTYYDRKLQAELLKSLCARLQPEGLLVVGAHEEPLLGDLPLKLESSSVYRKTGS